MAGKLTVIKGPMFSEKSTTLISRLRRAQRARREVIAFKPAIDNRYSESEIATHDGITFPAHAVVNADQLVDVADQLIGEKKIVTIGVDEVQFFEPYLVDYLIGFVLEGHDVVVAGLPTDFRGVPFETMSKALAMADEIVSLTAICKICGKEAVMTQRLVNGQPARECDPVVMVGGEESYEARCRDHHEVLPC